MRHKKLQLSLGFLTLFFLVLSGQIRVKVQKEEERRVLLPQVCGEFFNPIAESSYSVKYGSSNITSIVPSNNLFCFMSFQIFSLNNLQYWHFLCCFGFNLKKKSCRKSKYLQSTFEYLTE